MASRGDLRRVAQGLYRFGLVPSTMFDQLMEATLWPRRLGVISHQTALELWGLCDVNPAKVDVNRAILEGIETHLAPHLIGQAIDTARGRGLVSGPDLDELAALALADPVSQ